MPLMNVKIMPEPLEFLQPPMVLCGNFGKYSTVSTSSIYWAEPSKTCSMNLTFIGCFIGVGAGVVGAVLTVTFCKD